MTEIIVTLITTIGIVVNSFIANRREKKSKLNEKIEKLVEDNELLKNSNLSLIRSQIVSKCERYQKQGYMSEYARFCLEELYKNYKRLGGNHGIEILVNKTFELPLSKD